MFKAPFIFALCVLFGDTTSEDVRGILYPRPSETRDIQSLDGVWNFRVAPNTESSLGFEREWYKKDLSETGQVIPMPVPASYNDITVDGNIRDHVGLVWYDRTFFVSDSWRLANKRVWLRFSAVSYLAEVWVNGELAMLHEIGHLPFEKDITSFVKFGQLNRVTVACDNMLREDSVPQGVLSEQAGEDGKVIIQSYTFDFFNYAGIHRPVTLYTTPQVYIEDITVNTDIDGETGIIYYSIDIGGLNSTNDTNEVSEDPFDILCSVRLLDKSGNPVAREEGNNGTLSVPQAKFWWPYLMHSDPGYLYTLEVTLSSADEPILDVYRLPVGIRTLKWDNTTFYINNKPLYLQGFGRHEDSDIRGKGLDIPLVVRDYNLIKWVGANAYRTSHYPYADEIMDFADQQGIMIIDECPSVDTDLSMFGCLSLPMENIVDCLLRSGYKDSLLQKHKSSLAQLIRRDKNRPSVIMWSVANEARTQLVAANDYFGSVVQHVKSMDKSRPVTMALSRSYLEDKTGQHLDIISFNRYNGWYANPGRLDMIINRVKNEAEGWRLKYNKPVLMSEYGADTYEGLHLFPEYVWSEDYQVSLMSKHFRAFDDLRKKGWFIGEFIWNFADFKTAQMTTRVGGNKKGIFTRSRQPKASAHHLRRRYHTLANQLFNSTLPKDLHPYEVAPITKHTEL